MEATTTTSEAAEPERFDSTSFAKSLFVGEIEEEMVFPWPQPDPDEQERIRGLIAAAKEIGSRYDPRKVEEKRWVGDDVIRDLGEAGLLGLYVAEEYGGQGLSQTGYARVFETFTADRRDALDRARRPPVDRLQGDRAVTAPTSRRSASCRTSAPAASSPASP